MKSKKKPLFLRIQHQSVGELIALSEIKLQKIEQILLNESRQATLAHHWIQGVIRLKKAMEDKQ